MTVTVSVLAPTCSLGAAVPDAWADYWLVRDCEVLLAMKDMLAGTGTLNWSAATAITSWNGVTVGGTPRRAMQLNLNNRSLTGSVPAEIWRLSKLERLDLGTNQLTGTVPEELGDLANLAGLVLNNNRLTGDIPPEMGSLSRLTHLNLSSNSLTGDIPRELGWLYNLEELRLSGNSLTGCIPIALEDVSTNDLSSLNLLYCRPPTPGNLSSGTVGETSIALSWDAVSNASKYRVEYRDPVAGSWAVADDTITTGTSHTVEGLSCGSGSTSSGWGPTAAAPSTRRRGASGRRH